MLVRGQRSRSLTKQCSALTLNYYDQYNKYSVTYSVKTKKKGFWCVESYDGEAVILINIA